MTKHYENGEGNPLVNKPILDVLEEEGVDPIRILAKFASGELAEESDQQLSAAKELAQYVHPKKRALDVNKEIKASVTFSVVRFSDVMPDQAAIMADQLDKLQGSRMVLDNTAARKLMKDVTELDNVTLEAMRTDVEKLKTDEDGIIDV
ncbi:MAG TPA: hypothetical protein PLA71_02210 [Saccharofermentans sp.]|nr:hypothetical protein [Saccharofermentans sp.]